MPRARAAAAIFHGLAHVLDFGGVMAHNRGRFACGPAADAAALRRDWERALQRELPRQEHPSS
ncbi:MAG TPA: hypothetical protein VFQ45_19470 [Longimicrobium sp.]|nr:hypothetical protein [Longimicrobium sp.]